MIRVLDLRPWRARPAPSSLADWRDFAHPRYRRYHLLAVCQGLVAVLAGFEVVIPFALDLGCPPALAVLLGALPVAGALAQLLVPGMLARTGGNLRGLTVLAAALGDTRGLLYLLLAIAVAGGLLAGGAALAALAVVVLVGGAFGSIGSANLLAWHSATLPESERRLIVPRLMAVSLAVGGLLLLPIAVVLDGLTDHFGLGVYAVPFAIAGIAGLVEVRAIRRLPYPGRVIVPPRAMSGHAPESAEARQFLRVSMLNALGMGMTPYLAVYSMAVLGMSPGFAMTLGAVNMLTMVVVAAVAGARLQRGSSARMLRHSYAIRATAMLLPIAAVPGLIVAPLLMYATAMLGAVGFASGQLAANERLFRLIRGPTVIRQHGRLVARTSVAMVAGQSAAGSVLAVGSAIGYPAFALLYGVSSLLRVAAYRQSSPDRLADRGPAADVPVVLLPAGPSA